MSQSEGDSNPQHPDSYWMPWPLKLSGSNICCPLCWNTGPGGIFIYIWYILVKLTVDIITVRGKQHSFLTHKWMFLWGWEWACVVTTLTGGRKTVKINVMNMKGRNGCCHGRRRGRGCMYWHGCNCECGDIWGHHENQLFRLGSSDGLLDFWI